MGGRAGVGRASAASQRLGWAGVPTAGPALRVRFQEQALTGSREGVPAGVSLWEAGRHAQVWTVRQATPGELFPWTSASGPPRGRPPPADLARDAGGGAEFILLERLWYSPTGSQSPACLGPCLSLGGHPQPHPELSRSASTSSRLQVSSEPGHWLSAAAYPMTLNWPAETMHVY